MKIFLIILAIIYGLTSVFIYGSSLLFIKSTRRWNINPLLPPPSILTRIGGWIIFIIWAILPVLRWLLLVGVYRNFEKGQM